ncbi:MAG: hypothetical protein ACXQS2_04575 [Methermicoccaceae archaeon]
MKGVQRVIQRVVQEVVQEVIKGERRNVEMVKHKDVKALSDLQRETILKYIDLSSVDDTDRVRDVLCRALSEPETAERFRNEMLRLEQAGTIMLALSIPYDDVQNMDE